MYYLNNKILKQINFKIDIIKIIHKYIKIKKIGKNYMAICPFHDDHNPSLTISNEKKSFYCYGCKKFGNVFEFVQEIEKINFFDSVEKVLKMSNLNVDKYLTLLKNNKKKDINFFLIKFNLEILKFFNYILLDTTIGEKPLNYLFNRDLTINIIKKFNIGFAPKDPLLLYEVFKKKKIIDKKYLKFSGLFIKGKNNKIYSRFSNRIIFPIYNKFNELIAFSGRNISQLVINNKYKNPKYLNSPETILFSKKKVLYNFNNAIEYINKTKIIYLFEGFFDVISSYKAKIFNSVALMGTNLSIEHINSFNKIVKKIVICYDGDFSGFKAIFNTIKFLYNFNFEISIVLFPKNMDANEYFKKFGIEKFRDLLFNKQETVFGFLMYYYSFFINNGNYSNKLEYIHKMIKLMYFIVKSPIERDYYFNYLSKKFLISIESLKDYFNEIYNKNKKFKIKNKYIKKISSNNILLFIKKFDMNFLQKKFFFLSVKNSEKILFYRIFHNISILNYIKKRINNYNFFNKKLNFLYLKIINFIKINKSFNFKKFLIFLNNNIFLKKISIEIYNMKVLTNYSKKEIDDILHLNMLFIVFNKILLKKKELLINKDSIKEKKIILDIIFLIKKFNYKRNFIL